MCVCANENVSARSAVDLVVLRECVCVFYVASFRERVFGDERRRE
jgi:hypothetical protein